MLNVIVSNLNCTYPELWTGNIVEESVVVQSKLLQRHFTGST